MVGLPMPVMVMHVPPAGQLGAAAEQTLTEGVGGGGCVDRLHRRIDDGAWDVMRHLGDLFDEIDATPRAVQPQSDLSDVISVDSVDIGGG